MSFANPYNFVSIDEKGVNKGRQKGWLSHDTIGTYSGEIVCHMQFLSDFITAGTNNNNEKKQLRINGKIGIQASTLKGLIRGTAEAISNSCISMMSDKYKYRFMRGMPVLTSTSGVKYKRQNIRGKDYLVFDQKKLVTKEALIDFCNRKNGLCICCTLFGTSARDDTTEESFMFEGKLRFSDATCLGIRDKNDNIINEDLIEMKYLKKHSLSNPKNHHESFYLNENKIKGRKFYYHHQEDTLIDSKEPNTVSVELVKIGTVFKFTISFENLTEEEYGLLLTTLELEEGLGHKIGMGKPLGLGSCVIEVKEIKEFAKNRYLSIDNGYEFYNNSNGTLKKQKESIKKHWTKSIPSDLQCILTLHNGFDIKYPDRHSHEFKKKLHEPCKDFSGNKIKQI